ncbi:copper resistance CopC family protein [Actinomadura parmotrematis]|uniref:Copper resistance protein CopC n=1 Tax=Actinomadura parmotrematis TaxID=2864039 RepID=A0ABS7FL62_9ACTN|nr:copper resistance protein CopC [Actinomadura parmotrematis]MBW8480765.1 copper resistance protein CopC [Actinomadura parmotrematis]
MKRPTFRPLRRAGVAAALAALSGAVLFGTATPALAHTRLVSSTPGKDATAAGVTRIELVFSDKISVAKVVVKDGHGKTFQSGAAAHEGTKVTQRLTGALPAGQYTVAYAVVGEDGHRVQGDDLSFTAAPAAAGAEAAPSEGAAAAVPVTAPTDTVPAEVDEKADKAEGGSGTTKWIMIGVGALVGIGIGVGIVAFAKRRKPAAKAGTPAAPAAPAAGDGDGADRTDAAAGDDAARK